MIWQYTQKKKIFKDILVQFGFELPDFTQGGTKYIIINKKGDGDNAIGTHFAVRYRSTDFKNFNYRQFLVEFEKQYAKYAIVKKDVEKLMEIVRVDFPTAIRAHKIDKLINS